MVASVTFRSLPHDTLRLYLLVEEDLGPTTGLNVASPLDQGNKEERIAALALLRNSADPVVREYYQDTVFERIRSFKGCGQKYQSSFMESMSLFTICTSTFQTLQCSILIPELHMFFPVPN